MGRIPEALFKRGTVERLPCGKPRARYSSRNCAPGKRRLRHYIGGNLARDSANGSAAGNFYDAGNYGNWWSATEGDASYAWYRYMYYYSDNVYSYWDYKMFMFSLRCVRD
ncbi:MAG: hypothetical protein FWC23_03390 [Chitinispirillia bacterium]|nr:hypothetical protein [Chitinispirillia bacterium]MCL2268220.1 hypothetical protein [Chitinispirillia bacterium]